MFVHSFKPERWLSLPSGLDNAFSFHTFYSGSHGCIGKTMAIFEMKFMLLWVLCPRPLCAYEWFISVVRHLLRNFSFEPAYEGQSAKPTAAITMSASYSVTVLIHMNIGPLSEPSDNLPLRVKPIRTPALVDQWLSTSWQSVYYVDESVCYV